MRDFFRVSRRLSLRAAAAWTALLIFTGGCACCCGSIGPIGFAPDLEPVDLVDTWTGESGARLVLHSDGTFDADRLHGCADNDNSRYHGHDMADLPDGGTGRWTLGPPERLDPYQDLWLEFDSGAGWGWQAGDDEIVVLLGDPDVQDVCFFERSTS
ncbi:hypothetical protein Cs7R123_68520 [Catellatospora sp. TT07R-123]|uniref:hypothetical protein n=1 Tax=Catellatospora sp. TT07R-123 TaxID=2733863 RepID=UPI001B2B0ED9|nr:hypothetical protein [Catellatospora sp. TT07R-123]GHJ49510.1 hypothetical protein Cs7R123_68520 [Catellatospora sp. TT07R-123]